jgi:hypothetical protein
VVVLLVCVFVQTELVVLEQQAKATQEEQQLVVEVADLTVADLVVVVQVLQELAVQEIQAELVVTE